MGGVFRKCGALEKSRISKVRILAPYTKLREGINNQREYEKETFETFAV